MDEEIRSSIKNKESERKTHGERAIINKVYETSKNARNCGERDAEHTVFSPYDTSCMSFSHGFALHIMFFAKHNTSCLWSNRTLTVRECQQVLASFRILTQPVLPRNNGRYFCCCCRNSKYHFIVIIREKRKNIHKWKWLRRASVCLCCVYVPSATKWFIRPVNGWLNESYYIPTWRLALHWPIRWRADPYPA